MLNQHPLGIYEKAFPKHFSMSECLGAAKALGFDYMEISIDESDEKMQRLYWTDEQKMQLLSQCKAIGIDIWSMCLSVHRRFPFGSSDAHTAAMAHKLMEKAILFAKYLGIRVIQLAGYDVYYEQSTPQSREKFLEGMKWASALAGRHQVMLAMEIMDTPFMNSITKHLWYEEQIDSPWYKLYPDLGNLSAWGNDVFDELQKGVHSIVAIHIKDTIATNSDAGGKFKGVEFGKGCVDFAGCFSLLEELNYTGPYLIEMWSGSAEDDFAQIMQAKEFISGQFSQSTQ